MNIRHNAKMWDIAQKRETNIAITDETVRQTRKFLKDHPDEIKTEKPVWSGSPDTGIKGKYL